MNNLLNLLHLKNRYFILRHGRSDANEAGIILSDPVTGTKAYGLTKEGKHQVKQSLEMIKAAGTLDEATIIISSDFLRASETATIAQKILGTKTIIFSKKLRERNFGKWERKHNRHYQDVWDEDAKDATHTINDVESTQSVVYRVTELICDLEEQFSEAKILLVSHGDALQILQTGFEKVSSGQHRSLRHLETAEVRELKLL